MLLTSGVVGETLVLGGVGGAAIVLVEWLETGRPHAELVLAGGVIEGGAIDRGDAGAVEGVDAAWVARVAFVTREGGRCKTILKKRQENLLYSAKAIL